MRILERAFEHVKDWQVAVDGGAHVGNWSRELRRRFQVVHSFEPNPISHARAKENLREWAELDGGEGRVYLHKRALWEKDGAGSMVNPPKRSTATAGYFRGKGGVTEAVRLDALGLTACGLVKLDLEGGEFFALLGALETLRKHHPVLILEFGRLSVKHYGVTAQSIERLLELGGYRYKLTEGPNRLYCHD